MVVDEFQATVELEEYLAAIAHTSSPEEDAADVSVGLPCRSEGGAKIVEEILEEIEWRLRPKPRFRRHSFTSGHTPGRWQRLQAGCVGADCRGHDGRWDA